MGGITRGMVANVTVKFVDPRKRRKDRVGQQLLDLNQVAAYLGTSRRFVELEIERKRLNKIMLSTRTARVSREELERYIESKKV
jgi:excisionase family DNA binding protein